MLPNLVRISFFFIFIINTIVAQSNWISTCGGETPSLSQIMVDPCGSEITNEYIIFKTSVAQYDIRNLRVRVFNPQNNVLAGAINNYYKVSDSLTRAVVAQLNNNYPCTIGTVFQEAAAAPFNGIIPPNSTIIAFNNVPNITTLTKDVASIAQACGSRIYVVFGTSNVNLFYNNQPVSCPNGCVRRIYIDHTGQSDTSNFCSKYNYDSSLLPRPPNTGSNPPSGYGSGSYIRPLSNGTMGYGGGYLSKNNCFPDSALACIPPTLPDYGNHVWNVLGFKASNNYTIEKFKGYYVARGDHSVSTPPGGAALGNFEFNPALDGWGSLSSPSNANTIGGALQGWLGCTISNDTFSIQAKRQGFPCGYYYIKVQDYDDNLRIRIDPKGDGVVITEINNPPKGADIWQGYLGNSSKIDIYASDDYLNFSSHIIFYKDNSNHPELNIQKNLIQNLKCFNDNSGKIRTTTNGGLTPYVYSWTGSTPIASNIGSPTNLAASIYSVSVLDNTGCKDTLKDIVVTQPLPVFANAGLDIKVCGDFVENSSMGGNPTGFGGSGTLKYIWQPSNKLNNATTANPSLIAPPSVSGSFIVTVTDDSACVVRDTLQVTVFDKNSAARDTFVCNPLSSDTLIYRHTNVHGCDSIEFVAVKLLPKNTLLRDTFVCNSLVLDTLIYRHMNIHGCDSVEIVALKLLKNDTTILPILSRCSPIDTATQITKLTNLNGCDSVIIQRFILSSADTVRRDSFVCNTLTINELKYTYKNRFGCDSVEIVALKLLKNDTTILPILSRCSPTDTATQITKLTNIYGCDSVIVQPFILSSADTVRRDSFVCNTLSINKLSYTFKNRFSCDSVEIVALKLLKSDTTILPIVSRCSPTDTATQITKLTNINGCDSVIIQKFTLSNADTVRRDSFICNTLTINELKYTFKNRFGCDSVEIVSLKLLKNDTTILPILSRCSPIDTATQITKLSNINGCDSVIIQRFILSSADTVRRDSFVCNTLTINELKYTFKNRFGCDSVEIVVLKRLRKDTTMLTPLSRCDARDTATQIRRLTNSVGCDSIVVQPFLLANKDTTVFYLTSCNERDTGTVYTVLVNRFGCENLVIRRTHLVPSGIKAQLSIEKGLICHGDSIAEIALTKPEGGKPPYRIKWSNSATAERLTNLRADKYQVSITDARGCTLRDSIIIETPPPLSITTQIQSPRCFDEKNGSFTILKINGGNAPYRLQLEDKNILMDPLPYFQRNLPAGSYPVLVTDRNGCQVMDTLVLLETPQRIVRFPNKAMELKLGDSIRLSPEFNFRPLTWKWLPSHLFTCDTCLFPVVKPQFSITYKVIASDENRCETSAYLSVKVQKFQNVFPPNSFSPNGDGYNDRFTIFTNATVERIKILEIYNRWGGKVFENRNFLPNDENAGWDGTFQGQNAESTVYIYYFTVIYKDGSEEVIQGEVSLMQ